jgi:PIN domain nuclease of toxin-antitoxin system
MLLLDTHCWLWLKDDPSRLPSPLRRRLEREPENLLLSSVCILEIAIKLSTGKLKLGAHPEQLVYELTEDGAELLDFTIDHALRTLALPPLHRDPFDRLLVAQAQLEGLTLVSADPQVLAYDVKKIDARK